MVQKKKKKRESDEDEDETFYYRYASVASSEPHTSNPKHGFAGKSAGFGGLAPSKSTVYVSNLDYVLINSDIHTLFSTFGKIARVTILKDRHSRRSRGIAFVLYVSRDDAFNAAHSMDGKILNDRKLTVSIAVDNGRAPEFIKKRVYKDKSRCYECGDQGHLSYECTKNQLGPREKPPPSKKRGRRKEEEGEAEEAAEAFEEEENWASVVDNEAGDRLRLREAGEEEERMKKKTREEVT